MDRETQMPVQALLDLLDDQRGRLLSGDIVSLAEHLPHLELAVSAFASGTHQREDLERLRASAERGVRLLEESARGVRSVRRRMEELSDGRVSETYTSDGRRVAMSAMRKPAAP